MDVPSLWQKTEKNIENRRTDEEINQINSDTYQKLLYYKKEKTNITFRIKERPEYFFKGKVIELSYEKIEKGIDEDFDKEVELLNKKKRTKQEKQLLPNCVNYSIPQRLYHWGHLILELDNEEKAYFLISEISLTSIHPSSINPIQYFERKNIPDWKRDLVFERCRGLCELKLEGCTNIVREIDHWIPISKGGSDDITNLRGCCPNCNKKKSDNIL